MDWFWAPDLAQVLSDEDDISPDSVAGCIANPVAVAGEGDALSVARRMFGHWSVAFTVQRYAHVLPQQFGEVERLASST